jgi:DNA repair photolyase
VKEGLPETMKRQLERDRDPPDRMYFSTACDAFQPDDRVQTATHGAMLQALEAGKEIGILTKGIIREDTFALLAKTPERVFVQVGLITVDPAIAKLVEPGAPAPAQRLDQMKRLIAAGIRTGARIDPILPGLTDSREALTDLFAALHDVGIPYAAVSYLFLRPGIRRSMAARGDRAIDAVLREYEGDCGITRKLGCGSEMLCMATETRETKYKLVKEIAAAHGVAITICGCKNGDIEESSCCEIAGPRGLGAKRKIIDH